jgi:hypothetical protein
MPKWLTSLLKWMALLALAGAFAVAALVDAFFILLQFGPAYLPVLILGAFACPRF